MAGPRISVVEGPGAFHEAGAAAIAAAIEEQPELAIVAATGRTPMGSYRLLGREVAPLDVSGIRLFQLDEYVGIDPDDDRSLLRWMMRDLAAPLGLGSDRVVAFELGRCGDDPARACAAYDRAVADAGGLDLAILGLGPNGHLGFNEPPSDPSSPTRCVTLSPESVASNSSYWDGRPVPERAVTAGLSTLLGARRILVLVSGAAKREILARTLGEAPTPAVPSSFLQQHPDVQVIADRAAWGTAPAPVT